MVFHQLKQDNPLKVDNGDETRPNTNTLTSKLQHNMYQFYAATKNIHEFPYFTHTLFHSFPPNKFQSLFILQQQFFHKFLQHIFI